MSDLIDRQAAIEAMTNTLWHYPNECYRNLNEYEFAKGLSELGLKSVPSAQPDVPDTNVDTISRQALIESLDAYILDETTNLNGDSVREILMDLPSVQPERKWIPCKDEIPVDERNVFVVRGTKNLMSVCIGHFDFSMKQWYEDRNWFAKPIYDALFWCEAPELPEWEAET